MAATKDDIRRWFESGLRDGATHMIIACDYFDYDDYPVYVHADKDPCKEAERIRQSPMQKVMEVYSMTIPMEQQLAEHRAFHYDI
jgi:hypothetical protein